MILLEKRFYSFILIIFLVFLPNPTIQQARAALQLEIAPTDSVITFFTLVSKDFPIFSARIKAYQDGNQVQLGINNILIIENNTAATPVSVSPITDGWQTVKWKTRLRGEIEGAVIIAFYQNETAAIQGFHNKEKMDMSFVRFLDIEENLLSDLFLGTIYPGDTETQRIRVAAIASLHDSVGNETYTLVDSIKTHSSYFGCEWLGNVLNQNPPPVKILPAFRSSVRVSFSPQDTKYYRDKLSIYYDGGAVEEVNLIGNVFNIETSSFLEVISPNGFEKLTPCEKFTIKWRGYVRGLPTVVDYSDNGGFSWTNIGMSFDSTYVWEVPNIETDKALIRVRQTFTSTTSKLIRKDDIPVMRIAYNNDGTKLLAANLSGKIYEWDLLKYTSDDPYITENVSYPSQRIYPVGIDYTKDNEEFAVAYYKNNAGKREDYLAFFKVGEPDPVNVVALNKGFYAQSMFIDAGKRFIALAPVLGTKIYLYSPQTGDFIRTVDFNYPISAFTFNQAKELAAVALYNGEIKILSLPDFTEVNNLDFSDEPVVIKLGFAPNGEFLALGCKAPKSTETSGTNCPIYVVDLPSKQIVRSYDKTSSDPVRLDFSPVSTSLLVGSSAQPQITFWDLTADDLIGGFTGNEGLLTDLAFSPTGSSIATASNSWDNLWVRNFTYPEQDASDTTFRIIKPVVTLDPIIVPPAYIGTTQEYEFNANMCNRGEVPVVFTDFWILSGPGGVNRQLGRHFRLKDPITPDTLYPGECMNLPLIYNPLDTGAIVDTIIITTCNAVFYLPINSYGINRNLYIYKEIFDFGELCLGDTIEKEFMLIRNDDPIPVTIDGVSIINLNNSPFTIMTNLNDSTLQPGETASVLIRFSPKQLGEVLRTISIFHSGLPKYARESMLKGFGLGTDYTVSHLDLRFIAEIPDRTITIHNNSQNEINIESYTTSPDGYFWVATTLPIPVPALDSIQLTVHWTGVAPPSDVNLILYAKPCAATKGILLGLYSGISLLSIPLVEADPRGAAEIPVNYTNLENKPYNGKRFFEAEISINPRMFLPTEAISDYGTAELTKNEISGDRRIIGFRVDGEFPTSGQIAKIKGIAGLAESDTSAIRFIGASPFWGSFVNSTTTDGLFKLINLCGARRFNQGSPIAILSIQPNPADNDFNLEYEARIQGEVSVDLYDMLGVREKEYGKFNANEGINNLSLNSADVSSGLYKLVIRYSAWSDEETLLILR